MRLKGILRNLNVLNILLLGAIVLFTARVLFPMAYTKAGITVPSPQETKKQEAVPMTEEKPPSVMEYALVPEQNLFHPDRKIPEPKKDEQQLPKPEFVLYGTILTDAVSLAFLDDTKAAAQTPSQSQGRGKKQKILRKGETLSGFALKEIEAEKVVMVRGEEAITVYLNEGGKAKTREVPTAAPAAAGQPQPQVGQQPVAQPPKTSSFRPAQQQASKTQQRRDARQQEKETRTVPVTPPPIQAPLSTPQATQAPPVSETAVPAIKNAPPPAIPPGSSRSGGGGLLFGR